jgi:hypothetical protein
MELITRSISAAFKNYFTQFFMNSLNTLIVLFLSIIGLFTIILTPFSAIAIQSVFIQIAENGQVSLKKVITDLDISLERYFQILFTEAVVFLIILSLNILPNVISFLFLGGSIIESFFVMILNFGFYGFEDFIFYLEDILTNSIINNVIVNALATLAVIPFYIMIAYSLSPYQFILAKNSKITVSDVMVKTFTLMKGNRFYLFLLDLLFLIVISTILFIGALVSLFIIALGIFGSYGLSLIFFVLSALILFVIYIIYMTTRAKFFNLISKKN